MILPKSNTAMGPWLDKSKLNSGDIIKFVSEPRIEEGQNGPQVVAKVLVKDGDKEPKNVAINKPSQNALREAFGEDTLAWMDKHLTIEVEKTVVGGKRGYAMFVIPEGFELGDDNGYVVIQRKPHLAPAKPDTYPTEDLDPADIPF